MEATIFMVYISEVAFPFTDNSFSLNFEVGVLLSSNNEIKNHPFFLKEDDFLSLLTLKYATTFEE